MTELQLLQFGLLFTHALYGYIHHNFCTYSLMYGMSMIVLFCDFYYKAYLRPKRPEASDKPKHA